MSRAPRSHLNGWLSSRMPAVLPAALSLFGLAAGMGCAPVDTGLEPTNKPVGSGSGGAPGTFGSGGSSSASGGRTGAGGSPVSVVGGVGGFGSGEGGGRIGGAAGRGGAAISCGAGGGGAVLIGMPGGRSLTMPTFSNVVSAIQAPPPVTGGTLLVLRDGITAVAADADRDQVYVIDLANPMIPVLRATVALQPGDQPGRLAEDSAGQVHVVLRNGAALTTIDPRTARATLRRTICQLPRGIAYDKAADRLHVACAGGDLLTIAPAAVTAERTLKLGADLRDVVVDGDKLLVTQFRSAQVLVVDRSGVTMERMAPSPMQNLGVHAGVAFEPAVAWRAVPMPGGGAAMVHQRGMKGEIPRTRGGYGGPPCDTIVHTAVSRMKSGQPSEAGPAIPGFPLPVDLALSPDGQSVALISAGNGRSASGRANRLFVTKMDAVSMPWSAGCASDGIHGPATCVPPITAAGGRSGTSAGTAGASGGMFAGSGGSTGQVVSDGGVPAPADAAVARDGGVASGGTLPADAAAAPSPTVAPPPPATATSCRDLPNFVEPTAVAFLGADVVLVQTREPAQLWVVKQPSSDPTLAAIPLPDPSFIPLSMESRADLGHAVFHSNSGSGLACASCHPEGYEDGRTWNFQCEGPRRTQDISGGLSGTEPFHWKGDLSDFPTLMTNVFMGRMGGPLLTPPQMVTTLNWINTIPARPAPRLPRDPAVERGAALFNDKVVGCATCHMGPVFTNNTTVGVSSMVSGGGEPFQVPTLRGLAWRAPYMHNGCAPDLNARFSNADCGGGDAHGKTSHLAPEQLADLTAFLESL